MCTIGYSGNLAPVVKWTDGDGSELSSDTDTSITRVESRLNATMMNHQVTATTFFNAPTGSLPFYADIAINAPGYTANVKANTTPQPLGLVTFDFFFTIRR